jgi:hypothetical protein
MAKHKRANFANFLLERGFNVENTLKLCRFKEIHCIDIHSFIMPSVFRVVDADDRPIAFQRVSGANGSTRLLFTRPQFYVRVEMLYEQCSKDFLFDKIFPLFGLLSSSFPFIFVRGQECSTELRFAGFSHVQMFLNGLLPPDQYTGIDEFDTQLCFDFVLYKDVANVPQHTKDFCPKFLTQRAPADYLFKYNR